MNELINTQNLILEKEVFCKDEIEKRMIDGGFKSIAKFELFIWDLEIFLQIQRILGDKIILKGGAATQFYIPITRQRTSIDIDMICKATKDEVADAIKKIEELYNFGNEYMKFKKYIPQNPKLSLDKLETYYVKVPTICSDNELRDLGGKQEVKIEFLYSDGDYIINKIKHPDLFALETKETFNVLSFDNLIGDKLTTIGPNTIGVSKERSDEQFKQVYDVITLFLSNLDEFFRKIKTIRENYYNVAKDECLIHNIQLDQNLLYQDMLSFIKEIQQIENNNEMFKIANDFQSLYLRRLVNRDKADWSIVGYQLELIVEMIYNGNQQIRKIRHIEELLEQLEYSNITGPYRGTVMKNMRAKLENKFSELPNLSTNLFKKNFKRIIWELLTIVPFEEIKSIVKEKDMVLV
ncbi:MAG: hypothetical protein K0Q49_2176 [Haloplasmataceae bacterium]|jgi:hypothetical protein|nr:hypothetical protein [Haloplasmataceae bacterium]